jgi:hypothetical protein
MSPFSSLNNNILGILIACPSDNVDVKPEIKNLHELMAIHNSVNDLGEYNFIFNFVKCIKK